MSCIFLSVKPRSYGHFPSPTPSVSPRGIFNKTHLLSLSYKAIIKPTFLSLSLSEYCRTMHLRAGKNAPMAQEDA